MYFKYICTFAGSLLDVCWTTPLGTPVLLVVVLVGEKADMARAILMNAIQNVATMTVWSALAKDCQTVYLCGGVFEHQLPRDLFVYFFEGLSIFFGEVQQTMLQ